MKRKLVAVTQIAYLPIKIYSCKGLAEEHKCAGRAINDDPAEIDLDADLTEAEKYDTLIHELIHVANGIWATCLAEHGVREIATSLCQALRGITLIHETKVTSRRARSARRASKSR